jgi:hypothetical protein
MRKHINRMRKHIGGMHEHIGGMHEHIGAMRRDPRSVTAHCRAQPALIEFSVSLQ